MKLVPAREAAPPVDPTIRKMSNLETQMQAAVSAKKPADERVKIYRNLLNRYKFHHRSWTHPLETIEQEMDLQVSDQPTPRPMLEDSVAESEIDRRINAVLQRPDIFNFTPNGELVYRGQLMPGTNIVDLVGGKDPMVQEMFDTAVEETQQDDNFDGFSFYNEFYPRATSTPRPSSPIEPPMSPGLPAVPMEPSSPPPIIVPDVKLENYGRYRDYQLTAPFRYNKKRKHQPKPSPYPEDTKKAIWTQRKHEENAPSYKDGQILNLFRSMQGQPMKRKADRQIGPAGKWRRHDIVPELEQKSKTGIAANRRKRLARQVRKSQQAEKKIRQELTKKIISRIKRQRNTAVKQISQINQKRKAPTQIGPPGKWRRHDIVPELIQKARLGQAVNRRKRVTRKRIRDRQNARIGALTKLANKYKSLGNIINKAK